MHNRDVPIILVRPDDGDYPLVDLSVRDSGLEEVAQRFFGAMQIASCRFVEQPMPNQDYLCFWAGSENGIEYEVRRADAHAAKYPFWIWVGLENGQGYSDRLSEQAHSVAEKLRRSGWRCSVKGYSSAMGEMTE